MILEVMTLKIGWKSAPPLPLFFFFLLASMDCLCIVTTKVREAAQTGAWLELLNVVAGWADGRKLCPACLWMKVFACLDSSGCILIGKLFKTFYCPFSILSVHIVRDYWAYCSCKCVFLRCGESRCVFAVVAAEVGVNFVQLAHDRVNKAFVIITS